MSWGREGMPDNPYRGKTKRGGLEGKPYPIKMTPVEKKRRGRYPFFRPDKNVPAHPREGKSTRIEREKKIEGPKISQISGKKRRAIPKKRIVVDTGKKKQKNGRIVRSGFHG